MATHRVTTPAAGHTGLVGNVSFVNGVAEVDEALNPAELAYFRGAGYIVENLEPAEVRDVDGDGIPEALPRGNASVDVWRAFAVEHGMAEDEANTKSRDELVALYKKETDQ